MAKKDFDAYFKKTQASYQTMVQNIKDLENDCSSGMVRPEVIENMVKTLEPIKNSYNALLYVKYLLDMPVKKSKRNRYEKQHKQMMDK